MISPRFLAGFALVFLVLGTAAPARSARVAPLPPSFTPSAGRELRDRFQDALARGLQRGAIPGVDVMSGSDVRVRLQANEELLQCASGSCAAKAAGELRVDRLLVAEVEIAGKNYKITLRLLDQGGAEVSRTTETCDICTVREADEAVSRAAARTASLVVRPGPTDLAAQAQAVQPEPKAIKLPDIRPLPLPPVPGDSRRSPYRYGWISALALGGVFVAASIPFLVYASKDGDTNCDPSVARRSCPTIYKGNRDTGLGLLLGGLAFSGGAFAVFYYLDHRAQKRAEPHVSLLPLLGPVPGGGVLGVAGRF